MFGAADGAPGYQPSKVVNALVVLAERPVDEQVSLGTVLDQHRFFRAFTHNSRRYDHTGEGDRGTVSVIELLVTP